MTPARSSTASPARTLRALAVAAGLPCAQMLPATLIVPAIRPWFAARGAAEGAMHAFMSVNMLAAAIVAPLIIAGLRRWSRRSVLRCAAATDAVLLACFALPLPTPTLLVLRAAEGAAHVTALVALLATASDAARRPGGGRVMATAGTGLVAAIAFGTLLGTAALAIHPAAPFLAAAGLAGLVAAIGPRHVDGAVAVAAAPRRSRRFPVELLRPVGAAFVSRFAVGSLVVTFPLFAHRVHALSDREIGLCFSSLTIPFALAAFPLTAWCNRVSPRTVAALGVAGYASMMVALPFVPTPGLVPIMVASGLASAAVFGAVLVEASAIAKQHERAHAMALINGAGCLGMVFGPMVAGTVSALVGRGNPDGYRVALLGAAVLAVSWLVVTGLTWRRPAGRLDQAEPEIGTR